LHRTKEGRNILYTANRNKAKWIGSIWRRNCLLKHVSEGIREGRMKLTGRRGRRHKQLLNGILRRRGILEMESRKH